MKNIRAEKKEKIILAAMVLFAKKGFAGTSVADIANQAGIGKGTTYEYFKSKDDLFFETFEWYLKYNEEIAKLGLSKLAAKNAKEKLEVFAQSVTESLKDAQELIPLTFEFWAATGSSKYRKEMKALFKDFYKKIGDVLVAVIEDGIERGEFNADLDTASYVPAIVGAVDVMGLQAWFDDEFDIEKVMNGFFQLIIKALEKQKEESCIDI